MKCDLASCNSKQIVRGISSVRQGIQIGSARYCSVECFARAAYESLVTLCSRRVVEIPRTPRLSLALALLSKGYVTAEQLRVAANKCHWSGESLDDALVRLNLASDKQLAVARSAQWGYPVLAQEHIGHVVQADIPRALLDECYAAPIHYSIAAQRMLIGFVYRIEHSLLRSIEHITGCRVEPCFVTTKDRAGQMERLSNTSSYNEIVIDNPGTPQDMARTVGLVAEDITIREASFTLCKNSVWSRLTGKNRITDLIFKLKMAIPEAVATRTEIFDDTAATIG